MKSIASLSCLLVLTLVVACKDKAGIDPAVAKPGADAITDEALMLAVFGKDYRNEKGNTVTKLPDPEQGNKKARYLVDALGHSALDNGDIVLVANAAPANQKGESAALADTNGWLNIFILRHEKGGWKVVTRHENVDGMGSRGRIGKIDWVRLAKGKPGLAVSSSAADQGYIVPFLSLFDLSAPILHDLGGITIGAKDVAACTPNSPRCWNVQAQWRFEAPRTPAPYDDLLIDFSGEESKIGGAGDPKRGVRKIGVTARYAYVGSEYQLIEGENPVPAPSQ